LDLPVLERAGATNYKNKRILFIGSSGSGKSTLSNLLFNMNCDFKYMYVPFPVSDGAVCKTSEFSMTQSVVSNLVLIDTPGLNDNRSKEIVYKTLYDITNIMLEGIDLLFVITEDGRLTNEVLDLLRIIKNILGNDLVRDSIYFVQTHCDNSDPKAYYGPEKNKTNISKFINDKDVPESSRELMKYFFDNCNGIVTCTLATDPRGNRDGPKKEDRENTLKIFIDIIANSKSKMKISNSNLLWDVLTELCVYFLKITVKEHELKGYFVALYENRCKALTRQVNYCVQFYQFLFS